MNGLVVLGVAAAGFAFGLVWLIRVSRADPEPDQRAWRYRDVRALDWPPRDGLTPGQRGRRIGRVLIAVAVGLIVVTGSLWIVAPRGPSPMFLPGWIDFANLALSAVGITGIVVGLAWMIRIHRANPEPDQRAWRYRERD